MQPAHRHRPAQVDLLLQCCSITIGRKVGRQPQGPQGRELGLYGQDKVVQRQLRLRLLPLQSAG